MAVVYAADVAVNDFVVVVVVVAAAVVLLAGEVIEAVREVNDDRNS